MNRILTTIIALWSMCTMAGLPPTTLSGEQSATKPTTFTFEAPNYQGTQTSGIKSRVETGNTNLLVNPSFEHSTVTTGWTITNATATADTTNQVEGKKALSLALTGALSVVQDSTINAANLVGLQGNAGIKIKTSDVDGLKVCARNAGVTSTSLCINVPKDGVWKEINIPYILTATSNGIAITSTGTTGTVKLDDAFVGTSAPFQGVNGAKLVGTLNYSPTANCIWQTTSATFANFAADTDCSTPTVTGNIKAPSTKIPAIVLPAGSQSGTYLITAKAMFYKGTAGYASYRFSDGTNYVNAGSSSYADNTATGIISGQITYSTSINSDTTIQIQGKTGTGNLSVYSNETTDGLYIEVYYFPPESKIYSQASQDYDWTSYTPTFTGFGTTTNNECFHKRRGSDLLLRCKFTSGTTTATEARVSLPNSLVSANTSIIPSLAIAGPVSTTDFASTLFNTNVLIEPNVGYVTFGWRSSTTSDLSKVSASTWIATGKSISFSATIPIQGWQDYGVIVGSFAGIEKCANDYECTDTFSAQISDTGIVSGENIDWISGNCSISTSRFTCTLKSGLLDGVANIAQPMNCVASGATTQGGPRFTSIFSSSTTQIQADTYNDAGNAVPYFWQVTCQKAGQDYKPKTAKVADPAVLIPITSPISATNIDWSLIKVATGLYTKTLSANTTFTFSNLTAGQAINVRLTNTASNYTVTWPTVKWPGGTAPVMTTGAKSDIYSFFYDGTDIYGSYVQNY